MSGDRRFWVLTAAFAAVAVVVSTLFSSVVAVSARPELESPDLAYKDARAEVSEMRIRLAPLLDPSAAAIPKIDQVIPTLRENGFELVVTPIEQSGALPAPHPFMVEDAHIQTSLITVAWVPNKATRSDELSSIWTVRSIRSGVSYQVRQDWSRAPSPEFQEKYGDPVIVTAEPVLSLPPHRQHVYLGARLDGTIVEIPSRRALDGWEGANGS